MAIQSLVVTLQYCSHPFFSRKPALSISIKTRIPSGIWSRLYGWLLWMCVPRIGSFLSALNTWWKVWPWILIWAYLVWNFAPIFGQQISILDPPFTLDFWSVLVFRGEGGGSIGPPTFFCHGKTRDYLSRASQRVRGATENRCLPTYGLLCLRCSVLDTGPCFL